MSFGLNAMNGRTVKYGRGKLRGGSHLLICVYILVESMEWTPPSVWALMCLSGRVDQPVRKEGGIPHEDGDHWNRLGQERVPDPLGR